MVWGVCVAADQGDDVDEGEDEEGEEVDQMAV